MNPLLTTLIVIAAVALIVVRHLVFEWSWRRARENHTGVYRYSPPVRRAIVLGVVVLVVPLEILLWHTQTGH